MADKHGASCSARGIVRRAPPSFSSKISFRVCLAAIAVTLAGCGDPPDAAPIDHVEYQWGERPAEGAWKAVEPGAEIPREGGARAAIWFRVQVPPSSAPDPALRVRTPIFTGFEEMTIGDVHVPIADSIPILPLPRTDSAVSLRARPGRAVVAPVFLLGSQRALWRAALRREIPELLVAGTLLLMGFLLLASTFRRGSARAYRGLGLFLLSLGVLTLFQLRLVRTLVFPSDRAAFYSYEIGGFLFPLGFADFVISSFGDTRRKLIARGLVLYGVFTAIAWAIHLGRSVDIDAIRAGANAFMLFLGGVALVLAASRARAGDRAARAFLFGIGALLAVAMPDILDGMGFFDLPFQTVPYAVLAFGAAMTIVTERRMAETRDALQASAGELSRKVLALEERNVEVQGLNVELRHQIAERSRQLAGALQAGIAAPLLARALSAGDVVDGRYRVAGALGRGGMGAVHEVERMSDGRRLALKVMSGHPHPTTAARFAREAEIAARIAHPHLVAVLDVSGTTSEGLYLVMELVHGRSLEQARDRFGDAAWATPLLAQIAAGLAALHAAGVVHRDLKPGNVLLSRAEGDSEVAKISDFGISRFGTHEEDDPADDPSAAEPLPDTLDAPAALWAEEAGDRSDPCSSQEDAERLRSDVSSRGGAESPKSDVASRDEDAKSRDRAPSSPEKPPAPMPLTATGIVMGTPAYMAPELRRGARLAKPASDMFAFGLIAYELLSARRAFAAPPMQLALAKPLPAVEPLPSSIPADLAALVLACLGEAPERRPSAEEALSVLAPS